jgi:hypothetical protein
MKNKILYQNEKYTVLDISTETYPNVQTVIDNFNCDKIGNNKVYAFMLTQKLLTARIFQATYLHRFLMDAKKGEEVDHRNGNLLINIVSNLRICSHEENGRNKHKNTWTGVYWHKRDCVWTSGIRVKDHLIYLGTFTEAKDAAKAYNDAAIKYFGEFASLNKF